MHNTEKVIKHLEMIQRYIIRFGFYSFMIKGASLLLIITAQILLATLFYVDLLDGTIYPGERSFVWIVIIGLIVIVLGFRLLNAYVVQGERLFRFHYDKVRQQSDTDFNMYVTEYKNKPKGKFASAFFSFSLRLFYTIELIFALFIPTLFLLSN